MKITVNGQEETIEEPLNLLAFLQTKGLNPAVVVLEHNYSLAKKEDWSKIMLQEGDQLEILSFVGGG